MDQARRDLLKAGASAAILAAVPRPLMARVRGVPEPVPPITDPDVKELALRAVDAARKAGAGYADVRLTYSKRRMFNAVSNRFGYAPDDEALHVGVRALVKGYWGFASGTLWEKDEMDRLARQAVALAKVNTGSKERVVELATTPAVRDGNWSTPMEIDPFAVSPFEVADFLQSISEFIGRMSFRKYKFMPTHNYEARVQEKAFASSEGSYCTQRLQRNLSWLLLTLADSVTNNPLLTELVYQLPTVTSLGYEVYKRQPVHDYIIEAMDSLLDYWTLPSMSVEVGRFDAVCDARTVAALIHGTLSPATQLDRALGYEANASGTSYINDPVNMVGTYAAGSPELTLIGERSSRGGAASVQWDDEGVKSEDFPIVKDGVLVNFQTTRESATWLKDRSAAQSVPVRSNGCADSTNAVAAPVIASPNMKLLPAKDGPDFAGLLASLPDGLLIHGMTGSNAVAMSDGVRSFRWGNITMDFQGLNGFMTPGGIPFPGWMSRVKNGKQVAKIRDGMVMLRAPELWKGLAARGGEASALPVGLRDFKGEPSQEMYNTVTAPPAIFKQLTFIRSQ